MKASLIITVFGESTIPHFHIGDQKYHNQNGETELFRVTAEGQPHELASKLQEMAREEAKRRGIKLG
jgi:hypothetical protein